jgi:electron transfer flavoprotein alpha subunit
MTGKPLRVAVLVKQIPAIESMGLDSRGRLCRDGIATHMNDYCRRAVAQGCQIARESGGSITVLTLGPPGAEDVLREAVAFGADRGVHVTDPAFAGSDTLATARALAAALRLAGSFDLVFCGRNSLDADTGQVPAQLSALLGLPFAAGARELRLDGETLRLRLEHDDEWVDAEVGLPALISCAERLISPCKIKDPARLAAVDGGRIRRLSAADLGPGPWGQAGSPTAVGEVRARAVSRARKLVPDGPVADQVAAVIRELDGRAPRGGVRPETRVLPAAGPATGPRIVVAVEPGRPGLTRELLGAAAGLAGEMGGRVVAFGPAGGDPVRQSDAGQLGSWGADEVTAVDGITAEEDVARALTDWCRGLPGPPWAVLGPGTMWGRDVLARTAAALGAGLTGDAVGLAVRDGRLIAVKPAFGGLCVADIHCSSPIQLATVRAGVLPRPAPRSAAPVPVTTLRGQARSRVRALRRERDDDSSELAGADVVLGVGLGVAPEDYPLLRGLARQMGAVLAATRKVTDKGWLPRARQVGITGHAIEPRVYVSVGASGTFNHAAGVRAAGTIVAINTDPGAPVFGFADVGIVGDWKAILPELAAAFTAHCKGTLAK